MIDNHALIEVRGVDAHHVLAVHGGRAPLSVGEVPRVLATRLVGEVEWVCELVVLGEHEIET